MSDEANLEPEPYECEYCGDECEQLFHIEDHFNGNWDEPPRHDEMNVCGKCRDELYGRSR